MQVNLMNSHTSRKKKTEPALHTQKLHHFFLKKTDASSELATIDNGA
jgi:hypothetical protein